MRSEWTLLLNPLNDDKRTQGDSQTGSLAVLDRHRRARRSHVSSRCTSRCLCSCADRFEERPGVRCSWQNAAGRSWVRTGFVTWRDIGRYRIEEAGELDAHLDRWRNAAGRSWGRPGFVTWRDIGRYRIEEAGELDAHLDRWRWTGGNSLRRHLSFRKGGVSPQSDQV